MIVLACLALLGGTLIYVFAPVALGAGVNKTRLQYLFERREVIYDNLRDLNFEFKAGKYPEEDFRSMRTSLESEAANVLAEIESLEHATKTN